MASAARVCGDSEPGAMVRPGRSPVTERLAMSAGAPEKMSTTPTPSEGWSEVSVVPATQAPTSATLRSSRTGVL
jgi:hypothetical protein